MTVSVVRFVMTGAAEPDYELCPECQYSVVYDGHCKICGRLVAALRKWDTDRLLEIMPSQAAGVHARFPWIPAQAYQESVQVISRNGRTWQGAAAIEQLLSVLPKGRLVSWIFSIPFARGLAERMYQWFARHRYRLGCGEHCTYRPLQVDYEESQ
ncbi:MAG: thiol-disulfide oxidoreductase DCC family protein [Gemmatimonadaceae bacterium]